MLADHQKNSARIVVVGSINLDLVVRSQTLPRPGETLMGRSFEEIPGGKGANQAVAASRLGAQVSMIGALGEDAFADRLRSGLKKSGVDVRFVTTKRDCYSGVAVIGVDDSGQNCITVVPGANGLVTPEQIQQSVELIAEADVLLLQLEVPVPAVAAASELARQHGVTVIFDPAPAQQSLPEAIFLADVICPNESEAEILTGITIKSTEDAALAASRLCGMGARYAVVTMGHQGVVWCERVVSEAQRNQWHHVPAFPVQAVDTTAAGDAFAGALGIRLAEGATFADAVRFACAAGGLAASRAGAQPAMPSRWEVDQLVQPSE
ncbi:MAG: ribokinase [Planctomycetaceae bacterium]